MLSPAWQYPSSCVQLTPGQRTRHIFLKSLQWSWRSTLALLKLVVLYSLFCHRHQPKCTRASVLTRFSYVPYPTSKTHYSYNCVPIACCSQYTFAYAFPIKHLISSHDSLYNWAQRMISGTIASEIKAVRAKFTCTSLYIYQVAWWFTRHIVHYVTITFVYFIFI